MERQVGGTGGRAAPGSGTDDRQLETEEGEARVTREEEGKKTNRLSPKWKRGRPTTFRLRLADKKILSVSLSLSETVTGKTLTLRVFLPARSCDLPGPCVLCVVQPWQ